MPDTTETHGSHLTVPLDTCPSPGSPCWSTLNSPYGLNFNKKQPRVQWGSPLLHQKYKNKMIWWQEENSFQTVQPLLPKPQSCANKADAGKPRLTVLLMQGIRQCPEVASTLLGQGKAHKVWRQHNDLCASIVAEDIPCMLQPECAWAHWDTADSARSQRTLWGLQMSGCGKPRFSCLYHPSIPLLLPSPPFSFSSCSWAQL